VTRRRDAGLPHAEWGTWPPGAIRQLKVELKKHGAWDFHEGALKRWAKQIAESFPDGRESFNAELALFRASTAFLKRRCESADLLDSYIANLIDRTKGAQSLGNNPSKLEYTPGKDEDSSFTLGQAPLSITELCVRHQFCEHVRGRERLLLGHLSDEPSVAKLKRGDAAGIEALAQLFIS
jgi:hypothetical protein